MAQERGIKKIEVITGAFVWSTKLGGTAAEVAISAVLLDGTTIAEPEGFTTEMIAHAEMQDGVKYRGTIRVELGTANIPDENTQFWLLVTPHSGNPKYYGGELGCYAQHLQTGLTSLSSGRPYIDVTYTFAGATDGDVIKE